MNLKERLENTEREAAALRAVIEAYSDVREVDCRYIASVPFERCDMVNTREERGERYIRLGHTVGARVVWSEHEVKANDVVTWMLEDAQMRTVFCQAMTNMVVANMFFKRAT